MHLMSAVAIVLGLSASDTTELRREALMTALRSGGYTVILRHARTDRSFQEARDYVPKERSAQRNLNEDGIRDAALMGAVFRKYGIVFAEVISSPMYRTVETAELAVGGTDTTMALRSLPSTDAQLAVLRKRPPAGKNRLIVTHHFVIEKHVPTIDPGEIAESEAVVVRHAAGGAIELVGRITLSDWSALALPAAAAQVAHASASAAPTSVAHPQSAGADTRVPDTHAGHLAREYIAAFNSGNPDRMRAYIETYMVANPDRPMEDRLRTYTTLFEQHGPLSITSVQHSASTELTLGMRSTRGPFRLTIRSTEENPMRATSVTFAFAEGGHP